MAPVFLVHFTAIVLIGLTGIGCANAAPSAQNRPTGVTGESTQAEPLTPTSGPLGDLRVRDEAPEAAIVRLSALLDEGVARRDPALIGSALHADFPGREAEIRRLIEEGGDDRTAVEDVRVEEVEPQRAVLLATFRFGDHGERSRVLLQKEWGKWAIAGMMKVGEA